MKTARPKDCPTCFTPIRKKDAFDPLKRAFEIVTRLSPMSFTCFAWPPSDSWDHVQISSRWATGGVLTGIEKRSIPGVTLCHGAATHEASLSLATWRATVCEGVRSYDEMTYMDVFAGSDDKRA